MQCFQAQSQTMNCATNGVVSTPSTQQVTFPGAGATAMGPGIVPPVARIVNLSTFVIWISITWGARVAAIPAAGNTSIERPILPGTAEYFTVPDSQGGNPPAPSTAPPQASTLNINSITAGGVSQPFAVTFGEGVGSGV